MVKSKTMVEIKAGPELDWVVAEAIGWQRSPKTVIRNKFDEVVGENLEGWWDGDRYVAYETPRFSKDLDAAFEAAEKAGLFYDGMCELAQDDNLQWRVTQYYGSDGYQLDGPLGLSLESSLALAICAAILKV